MYNREKAIKLSSNSWIKGLQNFNNAVQQNSTLLQKYL